MGLAADQHQIGRFLSASIHDRLGSIDQFLQLCCRPAPPDGSLDLPSSARFQLAPTVSLLTQWRLYALSALPLVLDEPEPQVYFIGFGNSSLDFKLFVYSRELSERLPLMHAVHEEILAALRQNGIQIPFPQRDLHVRSVDEGVSFPTGSDPES